MTDEEKKNGQKVDKLKDEAAATTAVVDETTTAAETVSPTDVQAEPPGEPPEPDVTDEDPHADLAAFLLNALPADERDAFARISRRAMSARTRQ